MRFHVVLFAVLLLQGCSALNSNIDKILEDRIQALVTIRVYRKDYQENARENLKQRVPENLQHLLSSENSPQDNWILIQQGSGFFINQKGNLLSSFHTVSKAEKIEVQTYSGKIYEAIIEKASKENDLALLTIKSVNSRKMFNYIPLLKSTVSVGESVYCLRSFSETESTIVQGKVIALERDLSTEFPDANATFMETSCPTSKGFSGGPVLNLQGKAIGMNSHIIVYQEGQTASTVSLAVSGDKIRQLLNTPFAY